METWQIITGSIGAFIVSAGFIVGINAKVTTMILSSFYNKDLVDKGFVSKEQCALHHATNDIRMNTLAEVKEEVREIRREIGAFMSNVRAMLDKILHK